MAFSFFRRWRQKGAAIPAQAPVDDDMEWFFPPADVHDPICWDQYWKNQVAHGVTPRLCDLFSFFVPQLIDCLQKRGARTVLCAGNGGSQEPKALAAAGFQVTVMDLSPAALFLAEKWEFTPKDLDEFCTEKQRMRGGSVKFVTGDIVDVAVCPGPFDAIIERRM